MSRVVRILTRGDEMSLYDREMGGDWSVLSGGDWSTLVGGFKSTLTGGAHSTLMGGAHSVVTGGFASTLIGSQGSTLSGGDRSALTWKYFDGERVRMYTIYVGQDGILADTAYYGRWNYVELEFQIERVPV